MSLRIVGIYLREVEVGPMGMRRQRTIIERPYIVLAYGDQIIGKLAIGRDLFDRMRADGIPLIPPVKRIARARVLE